jgi:nucleotide-binding universal stress UspA family protein
MAIQVSPTTVDQLAEEIRRTPTAGRPVVVGVGLSDPDGSKSAAEWGAREAKSRGTDLHIVSAYHPKVAAAEGADDTIERQLQFNAKGAVEAAVEAAAAAAPGLVVSGEIIDGPTPDVLLELSADAGVVVLGARHLNALNRAVLGSVGTSVAAMAKCPVVVLMSSPGSADDPGDVVVGVSIDESALPVLDFAFAHAERHKLAVRPVLAVRSTHLDFSAATVESIKVEHELDDIVARVGNDYPNVTAHNVVRVHRAVDALLTESLRQNLLVLGRQEPYDHPGWHPLSVSMRVLHHAVCPVAIVPYAAESEPATPND